jgi:hypothetical protein
MKTCNGCHRADNMYVCPYPICACCKHSFQDEDDLLDCRFRHGISVDDDGYCSLYEQEIEECQT